MARLSTLGAELGAIGEISNSTGTVSVTGSPVRSGSFAYAISDTPGGSFMRVNWAKTPNHWVYSRGWFRVTALPPSPSTIAAIYDSTSVGIQVSLRTNGTLARLSSGGVNSAAIGPNEWHCLEIGAWGDGANLSQILRLDGVTFDTFNNPSAAIYGDNLRFGWTGGSTGNGITLYVDDVAINDDTGSDQNSWPGVTGKIELLKPVTDQAVGSDWTLGTGTAPAGSAWDALNNTPPLGVANGTAGSDVKQVRDSVSAVAAPAADADLKLAAYSTVVPAGQAVRVVQAFGALGHTSNTVTQDVEFGLLANPPESRAVINLPIGIAGTYPSNWRTVRGAAMHSPVVVGSDQPVIRVGKRTANTVAVMASLTGAMVEYGAPTTPIAFRRFMAVT